MEYTQLDIFNIRENSNQISQNNKNIKIYKIRLSTCFVSDNAKQNVIVLLGYIKFY